jgi:dephospho-CoA kinase
MTTIAVTGNIASGKSLVAEMLRQKGCALIDADKVAHGLYASNPALVRELAHAFGDVILRHDGSLDRARLGAIVFQSPEALKTLNALVHPHLLTALREEIAAAHRMMNTVVVDAALIFEWGIQGEFDAVILVTAPEDLRVERLMARSGLSREDALARVRSQMPQEEKRRLAKVVIENVEDQDNLQRKSDALWISMLKTIQDGSRANND